MIGFNYKILAIFMNIIVIISTFKSCSNSSKLLENCVKSREKRLVSGINFERVTSIIFGPEFISNDMTFRSWLISDRIFGYIIGGTAYNFILNNFDLTEDTRKTIQQLDILYEPTNMVRNIFGIIRSTVFGLGTRIAVDLLYAPTETYEEFKSITIKEFRDRILSTNFQNIIFANVWYSFLWILIGAITLNYIANLTRDQQDSNLSRSNYHYYNDWDLHNYLNELNVRIDDYESSCFDI